jgi:alpha-ketoglutarate-dependent 2,4-dichlorophenoxyacetate dioxygenase
MHDIAWSRGQLGFNELLFGEKTVLPPVPQRVVRTHPGSKRKVLYVAAHAEEIVGMPVPEGRLLLRELIEHATQREFVYRHEWRQGDLVIWDNRATMHRGRGFDETRIRDLRRVTTRDVASTLDQVA